MASALRNVLPAQPPSNVKEVGLYGYGAVVVASAFYGACYGLKEYSKQKTRKRRVFDGALKSFEGIYNTGKEGRCLFLCVVFRIVMSLLACLFAALFGFFFRYGVVVFRCCFVKLALLPYCFVVVWSVVVHTCIHCKHAYF